MAAVLPVHPPTGQPAASVAGPLARRPASPSPGLLHGATMLAARDLRLAWRRRTDTLCGLAFFAMVATLFPLALGPQPQVLREMAGGVLWVAALLAVLLSLPRLFGDDQADGTLEQLLLSPSPLALLVLGKVAAHWLTSGALLALAAPVIALQYGLPWAATGVLVASLLLGTPVLSLLGAVAAALAVGLRGGAMLLSLLVLPLCVPVLVFGVGAVDSALAGQPVGAQLSLLGAALLLSLAAAPWACAAALHIAVET